MIVRVYATGEKRTKCKLLNYYIITALLSHTLFVTLLAHPTPIGSTQQILTPLTVVVVVVVAVAVVAAAAAASQRWLQHSSNISCS